MVYKTLNIGFKLTAFIILGLINTMTLSSIASADEPVFLPLGSGTKMLTPKKYKYPRLFPGTTEVDFFVQGNDLDASLSGNLSTACARGNFNQKLNKRYYVMVDMPNGSRKKFGFADYTGINLTDPGNRVGPNQAYLFEDDKTSECKVYAILTEW